MRVFAALLLLITACAAPNRQAAGPPLVLEAPPSVRVLALELEPTAGGLQLAGRLRIPGSLPASRGAVVQGLDAAGAVLFEQALELDVQPRVAARPSRRWAVLSAELPRPEALASVRLSLPAP